MTTLQKQKGFTAIPNDILEQLMKFRLNATQLRILLAVIRYTYGFQRSEHRLSDSYLAKAIGVSRTNLNRDIGPLIKSNILIAVSRSKTDKNGSVLKLNQNLDTWIVLKPLAANEPKDFTVIRFDSSDALITDNSNALNTDSTNALKLDTQERKELKKDIKEKEKESVSPNKTITANKTDKADKTSFGTYGWVLLSAEEHKGLLSDYGADVVEHYISIVDSRAQSNNNKYGYADWGFKVRQAIKDNWGGNPTKQSYVDKDYDIEF